MLFKLILIVLIWRTQWWLCHTIGGETSKDALRVNFDQKLKLEFHGTKVTSDASLLAYIVAL